MKEPTLPISSSPGVHPGALWAAQLQLLRLAEDALGPRDASKKIYQPVFADDGPFIRNTPNLDGAFAELSRNAESYWPMAIYELAHETVHLLNPKPGVGNWLSEGIAVAFSVHAQVCFKLPTQRIGVLLSLYQNCLVIHWRRGEVSGPLAGPSTVQLRAFLRSYFQALIRKSWRNFAIRS